MKRNRPDGRQGERGRRGVEWRRRAEGMAARAPVEAASRGRAYGSVGGYVAPSERPAYAVWLVSSRARIYSPCRRGGDEMCKYPPPSFVLLALELGKEWVCGIHAPMGGIVFFPSSHRNGIGDPPLSLVVNPQRYHIFFV